MFLSGAMDYSGWVQMFNIVPNLNSYLRLCWDATNLIPTVEWKKFPVESLT